MEQTKYRFYFSDAEECKNLLHQYRQNASIAYPGFAHKERIQLEQIEADKRAKGAYNLGRINALHARIADYYPKQSERAPATKYLDLSLMLFWWLEKNGQLSTTDKVDKLYALISDDIATPGTDYESITNRELALNTKGLVPKKV